MNRVVWKTESDRAFNPQITLIHHEIHPAASTGPQLPCVLVVSHAEVRLREGANYLLDQCLSAADAGEKSEAG